VKLFATLRGSKQYKGTRELYQPTSFKPQETELRAA